MGQSTSFSEQPLIKAAMSLLCLNISGGILFMCCFSPGHVLIKFILSLFFASASAIMLGQCLPSIWKNGDTDGQQQSYIQPLNSDIMRLRPESAWRILTFVIIVLVICFDIWLVKLLFFPAMSYIWVFFPIFLATGCAISFAAFCAFAWFYSVIGHICSDRRDIA